MSFIGKGTILAGCASLALGMSGSAFAASEGQMCQVKVDRSQDAGVFDVTRVVADDGDCVCYVYTGPASQGEGAEGQVKALTQSKSCPNAKVSHVTKPAGAGGAGGAWATLGAAAAFGGFLAVASDQTNDNDTPISP